MLSKPEFKKRLGPSGGELSDAQIDDLYVRAYKLADVIFDWWLRNRTPSESGDDSQRP